MSNKIEHALLECNKCHKSKPTSEFHKCKARTSGYQSRCKVCHLQSLDDYRKRTNCSYWKHKSGQKYSIYKITNPKGYVYIGYTSTSPKLRHQRHLADYRASNIYKMPILYNSFDMHGFENHTFEVIAETDTRIQARQRETREILTYMHTNMSLNQTLSAFPVAQYTKEGEWIKNWDSVEEASMSFGREYKSSWIYGTLNNTRCKTAHGFVWKALPFEDGTTYDFKTKKVTLCSKD